MSWNAHQRRAGDVRARAKHPDSMYSYCRAMGCRKPARAGTDEGLDRRYCRQHADHYRRHGSPFVGSYPARVLNPNRRAAIDWLLQNPDDFWVKHSIRSVEGLYRRGGAFQEAFRLSGRSPRERSRANWARLRHFGVDPRLVVAAWLGVKLTLAEDDQAPSSAEYARVQAAKVVHRMASGSHKRWESTGQELHKFPQSRGRVLRYIGKDLEQAVESLEQYHLPDIADLKHRQSTVYVEGSRPYPKTIAVRGRYK